MKHFTRLTGAIVSLIAVTPALRAYDFSAEGFYFNLLDESVAKEEDLFIYEDGSDGPIYPKCVEITYDPEKYAWRQGSYSGDIQLPLKVTHDGEDYYIVNIGEEAFRYCDALTSVTLSPAAEYFADGGFLRNIRSQAFANSGIKSLNGSTEHIKMIEESAFANSRIESFTCYTSTYLFPEVFASSSIKKFNVISNNPDNEFFNPSGAFRDCTNLIDVSGGPVNSIGSNAFEGCVQLTSGIEAQYIGECAYKGCTSLSRFRFYTTTYVHPRAFENCTSLSDVDFCSSGKPLEFASGLHVFDGCTSLKNVTINRKFVVDYDTMEECNPFEGCPIEKITFKDFGLSFDMTGESFPELKEIQCATLIPPHIGTLTSAQYRDINVTVPKQVYTQYSSSPYWKNFASLTAYEDDDLTGIVEINDVYYHYGMVIKNPFGFYTGRIELVNEYTMNDRTYNIFGIDEEAFYNCRNLTEVVFPTDCEISLFSPYAFAKCGIKEIDLSYLDKFDYSEDSFFSISMYDNIFWDCQALTKVTLPMHLTTIPKGCFQNCEKLSTIKLPERLDEIGDYAFLECKSLGNGTIDLRNIKHSNSSIGKFAFKGCNLTDVIFPDVKDLRIGREAFADNKLRKIDLPEAYIDERAFANNLLSDISFRDRVIADADGMIADGNNDIAVVRVNSVYPDYYVDSFDENCNWFTTSHIGKVVIEGYNYALKWNWKTWNVDIIENHQYSPATLDEFTEEQYNKILVYVPVESYESYRTAHIWEKFKNLKGIDYSSLNSVLSNTDVNIEACANQIVVSNVKAGTPINIYSIDGQQIVSSEAVDGVTNLTVPAGIYLVTVSGTAPAKVAVR